jgi:hypothetical protein
VTALAALLRLWQPDLAPLRYDDVDVLSRTRDVLTRGLTATGPLTSWGIPDPAGSVYLMLPAALMPAPATAAVVWGGLLSTLAVALTCVLVCRYLGTATGIVAGLLFAVNPWAVYFSRRSWAEIVPLLTVAALWSAYAVVGRKESRWAVPFFVALAAQVQVRILAFIYGPAALLTLLIWPRRWGLRWPALGIGLGALLAIPYLLWIGVHWAEIVAKLGAGNRGIAEAPHASAVGLVVWLAAGFGLLPAHSDVAPWLDPLGQAGVLGLGLVALLLAAGLLMGVVGAIRRRSGWEAMLLAGLWLVLPFAALIAQSSSVYLHYLVALFPAVFIVLALPVGWLLARGRWHSKALGVAMLGFLVIFQLLTTGLLYWIMQAYDVDDPPSSPLSLRQAAAGLPRDASELLGTGERYGVEVPIRFWQTLANAATAEADRTNARDVFVVSGEVDPLTAERPAVLDYLLRPRVEPTFLAADTLIFPMLRPSVYVELPDVDPIESMERFGERRARVPIPSGNRDGRSYARVTAVPARGPQGWEALAPTRLTAGFDQGVRFMGYRADQRTARAGDDLAVTTMWWLSSAAPSGPIVSLRLVDSAGKVSRSLGPERPLPTMPPGDWVLIRRDLLSIDGRLEAGQYTLEVAITDSDGRPLRRTDGPGESVQLAPIRLSAK